jgi:Inhibitor of vertebrate lysozyme (Ivy)
MASCIRMTAFLLIAVLATLASMAQAQSPDIYIWDVLKRPNYIAAYRRMVSGEKQLPTWVATPNQLSRSVTTSAGTVRTIGGNTEAVFAMCKAHECDTTAFVIFFSQYGDVAKSVLRVNGNLRFFGYPTPDERQALISELPPQ